MIERPEIKFGIFKINNPEYLRGQATFQAAIASLSAYQKRATVRRSRARFPEATLKHSDTASSTS